MPKPDADLSKWIYRWTKKLWKIRTGLSRAVGPGPLGCWPAGLLLAKPAVKAVARGEGAWDQGVVYVSNFASAARKYLQDNA